MHNLLMVYTNLLMACTNLLMVCTNLLMVCTNLLAATLTNVHKHVHNFLLCTCTKKASLSILQLPKNDHYPIYWHALSTTTVIAIESRRRCRLWRSFVLQRSTSSSKSSRRKSPRCNRSSSESNFTTVCYQYFFNHINLRQHRERLSR